MSFNGQLLTTNSYNINCPVVVWSPAGDVTVPTSLVYQLNRTVNITSMTPLNGTSLGGTLLTLMGSNFGSSVSVLIDDVVCAVQSNNSTVITCITSPKNTPTVSKFVVTSDGVVAGLPSKVFVYADVWSTASGSYWLGESAPRDNDNLLVRYGTTLIVDCNTPVLGDVIVDGTLLFADAMNLAFKCQSITISSTGRLAAGTFLEPRVHMLSIQTNSIRCLGCKLDLNGVKHAPNWCKLSSSSTVGASSVSVNQRVNWGAGDEILISATSTNQRENEIRVVRAVVEEGRELELNDSLRYQHISMTETYGATAIGFKAEVALLSRSISVDSLSTADEDGVSIVIEKDQDKIPIVVLTNVVLYNCGSRSSARHCIDVRVDDVMFGSKVSSNVVRRSSTRGISIAGASDLVVSDNVVLNTHGSAIVLDKGSEMRSLVTNNLVVSTYNASYMQFSDLSATGISTQSPWNNISSNTIATSEYDGLAYKGSKLAKGCLAIGGVCPIGMRVLYSANNTLRSCTNNGLTITQMVMSNFACEVSYGAQSTGDTINSLTDFNIWGNLGTGLLALRVGNLQFSNFTVAQHNKTSIDICRSDLSNLGVLISASRVVGGFGSQTYTGTFGYNTSKAIGLSVPNTDLFSLNDTIFTNFGSKMTAIVHHSTPCSSDTFPITSTLNTNKLQFANIVGKYHTWAGQDTLIFDQDGSIAPVATTITSSGGWMIPDTPLLVPNPSCRKTNANWDGSSYCSFPTEVRTVHVFKPLPSKLTSTNLSVMVRGIDSSLINKTYNSGTTGWNFNLPLNE